MKNWPTKKSRRELENRAVKTQHTYNQLRMDQT